MNIDRDSAVEQVQSLIDTALSGKHAEIEQINTINEYFVAKTIAKGLYKLALAFSSEANRAYKEYITNLKNQIDNVQLLIDYRMLKQCEKYYNEEYYNTWSSVEEYRNYLLSSNLIKSLFGYDRRDDDYE